MAPKTSSVDRIFITLFKDMIDTLEPGVRHIPRLNKLYSHLPLPWRDAQIDFYQLNYPEIVKRTLIECRNL
jgi:hypothetical protein